MLSSPGRGRSFSFMDPKPLTSHRAGIWQCPILRFSGIYRNLKTLDSELSARVFAWLLIVASLCDGGSPPAVRAPWRFDSGADDVEWHLCQIEYSRATKERLSASSRNDHCLTGI